MTDTNHLNIIDNVEEAVIVKWSSNVFYVILLLL